MIHGDNFEKGRNTELLGSLGDPTRWGSNGRFSLLVPIVAGTYTATGPVVVYAQVPQLAARGWALFASFSASGLNTGGQFDQVSYYLDCTLGAGQNMVTHRLDLKAIAGARPWWVAVRNSAGEIQSAACQLPEPLAAATLTIAPVAVITHGAPGVADHVVTFDFNVQVSPWSPA